MEVDGRYIKTCKKCQKKFLTYFSYRKVCSFCICKMFGIDVKKEGIDTSLLKLWDEED